MLGAKLIAFAAALALASADVTIHLEKNLKDEWTCDGGLIPISVEGVADVYCAANPVCVAETKGNCPGQADGLPYGAYCDRVKTGVLGCKPMTKEMYDAQNKNTTTAPSTKCQSGWSEMSVEGVPGIFCVQGQACVANIQGACPGPQDGLPNGAVCDRVKTGVLGCKPKTGKRNHKKERKALKELAALKEDWTCDGGLIPISVEGVPDVYCAANPVCVAETKGNCPGQADGLPYGAYCDRVKTGVLGCKPMTKEMYDAQNKNTTAAPSTKCQSGWSEMSVEGVPGIFCVQGQACVANIQGACPGPQAGLPNGAICDRVKTGVLGCKPKTSKKHHHKKQSVKCQPGYSPTSVEGVAGVFCAQEKVCAGVKGNCPGAQPGLPNGSKCDYVKTGVLGCKPN